MILFLFSFFSLQFLLSFFFYFSFSIFLFLPSFISLHRTSSLLIHSHLNPPPLLASVSPPPARARLRHGGPGRSLPADAMVAAHQRRPHLLPTAPASLSSPRRWPPRRRSLCSHRPRPCAAASRGPHPGAALAKGRAKRVKMPFCCFTPAEPL
jgi:hypothetical protein